MPEDIGKRITQDFGLIAIVATEIEFYLHGIEGYLKQRDVLALIASSCRDSSIPLMHAEAERGPNQYEISLQPTHDLAKLAHDTERFKTLMAEVFSVYNVPADFSAKPMRNTPGSGLHIHAHLEDAFGKNVFVREEEEYSQELLHSIGGMLKLMNPCMTIFAPTEASYDRFNYTVNEYLICPTAANVPLTVSWGTNNRTVAIRLPQKAINNKHIEHRVAGSDADVAQVISAILLGVHYGLTHTSNPGEPVFGDASLPQYNLRPLAKNLSEAKEYNKKLQNLLGY